MRFTDERLSLTHPYSRHLRGHGREDATEEEPDGPTCPGPLIVVSNRQPYRHEYADDTPAVADSATGGAEMETLEADDDAVTVDEPTGGLTAGLDPVLRHANGTWIAWGDGDADFAVADGDNCVSVPPSHESYTLRRIDLSDEAVDSYYYGFSNQVLWPICHGFPDLVSDRDDYVEWYRTVNDRFAAAVETHASADSVVWLQDYHLGLAPRTIRDAVPDTVTVAQFWHIPWPSPEVLAECPVAEELLEGLLGNDLLGFHVDSYVDTFLASINRLLPSAAVDPNRNIVRYDGWETRVVATPMGIDAETYDRNARTADDDRLSSLFDALGVSDGNAIGLGVDRLDYTKGIPERLAAVERFFERNPAWRGEFTFVQKATPSRTEIPTYQRYGDHVRREVERINDRFATDDWRPIAYTESYLEAETLSALYRRADVMVVSPLVDGMNLVAQEYVASSVDRDGTLLLSDRVGAHERLGSHALSIDPADTEGVATRIEEAVSMPRQERRRRMDELRSRVFENDIESWMSTQFDWIQRVRDVTDVDANGTDDSSNSGTDHDVHGHTPSL
ncbi:alpha,alpha-trehalose-phosphate synthase (UDP-forming) [Natrarchaeobius oligotrophus]|uniref:Trehalose-6-phosphate synthase n=1 Tax=Natrarchaeobius chitinivorans TaxID=1679083 RepID=A0A3N6PI05_NATCH|nr:trehalose-6-phosphate synthase [Natrarchaeobius chitinivorans]RQH00390.1 trehalose-6-phosphate synthase [Natrarchaeobius chitinivorans]